MEFATKIAVVVREDLAVWQKLNVTAFVAGGVASVGETVGQPYEDADGREYLPMLRQPVFVYSASKDKMRTVYERAIRRGVRLAVYTEELFATNNDDDNRAAVRCVSAADLNLVGLAVYGDRKAVDKVVDGLKFHE